MRRLVLALVGACLLLVLAATPALAHPLGNFTVNRYSRVEVAGSSVRVLYILDLAEIPTFQEQQRIQADPRYLDHKIAELARGLSLRVDGRVQALRPAARVLSFHPGQGGLTTMRLPFTRPQPLIRVHTRPPTATPITRAASVGARSWLARPAARC